MSNPFSDWLDSICVTIGICDEEPETARSGGVKEAAEKIDQTAADENLKNKECTDGGSSDDGGSSGSSIPDSDALWGQAQGLNSRMNAITRAVHKMIENGPTECGRPTDPTVISLNQRQQAVGSELSELIHMNWKRMDRTAQYAHVNALAAKISKLECDVKANL